MIEKFVKAWDKNNELLLKEFEKENPTSYNDIVEKLVTIVINPYLEECEYDNNYPYRTLNIKRMTTIDDGEYQGTLLYIIPLDTYQPDTNDYVFTHNDYGSCCGCDTFQGIDIYGRTKEEKAKDFHTLALHLLQRFKPLDNML